MTAFPAHNTTHLCPQRHTCELHGRYLEAGSGPVSLVSVPLFAGDGCYMYDARALLAELETNND